MIQELELSNFTVFKKAHFKFGANLNIFVGENGSGKTHILKALYAMLNTMCEFQHKDGNQFDNEFLNSSSEKFNVFRSVFNVSDNGDLLNWNSVSQKRKFTASAEELSNPDRLKMLFLDKIQASLILKMSKDRDTFDYLIRFSSLKTRVSSMIDKQYKPYPLDILSKGVFFPCRELLTIFPHYLSLRREYVLPYDSTYDDTISKLGLPPRSGKTARIKSIIDLLEETIQGTIFLKNERFYYHANNTPVGLNWEIDMIAEGWRKLGMLLQLLEDGSLREGMVLFWDEPEANLNPQLIKLIAMVIIQLSQLGIQVFIATHSLFLVNELEILLAKQKIKDGVRFFNLRKGKAPQQGDSFSALKNVLLLDEEMMQSDRYMGEEV